MTDPQPLSDESTMTAALKQFGWTCGPEFWERYYQDAWVFNLANAIEHLVAMVEQVRKERDAKVRQLEDALLTVWAELPVPETILLGREMPRLMDFIVHLHHSIEHEQAMVRRNIWAEPPVPDTPTPTGQP